MDVLHVNTPLQIRQAEVCTPYSSVYHRWMQWGYELFNFLRECHIFDATLGYPGEGPGRTKLSSSRRSQWRDSVRLSTPKGLPPVENCVDSLSEFKLTSELPTLTEDSFDESLPLLNNMFRTQLDTITERRTSAQEQHSILQRLWHSTPVWFGLLLAWSCCFFQCDVPWLYQEHLQWVSMNQTEKNRSILGVLCTHLREDEVLHLNVRGREICEKCYCGLIGVSDTVWHRRKQESLHGKVNWEHGNSGRVGDFTSAGFASRMWMKDWFESLGDWQPDTGITHITAGLPKSRPLIYQRPSSSRQFLSSCSISLRISRNLVVPRGFSVSQ